MAAMTSVSDEKWRPFNCFLVGSGYGLISTPVLAILCSAFPLQCKLALGNAVWCDVRRNIGYYTTLCCVLVYCIYRTCREANITCANISVKVYVYCLFCFQLRLSVDDLMGQSDPDRNKKKPKRKRSPSPVPKRDKRKRSVHSHRNFFQCG